MNKLASPNSEWQVKRLRFLLNNYRSDEENNCLKQSNEVTFLPMEAVGELGGLDLSIVRPKEDVEKGYTLFFENDVLVAKITPCFENGKGAFVQGLFYGVGYGTTELYVLNAGSELLPRFLFYLTISDEFRINGEAAMKGAAGQKRVPNEFIQNFRVCLPQIDIQKQIADYLDQEITKIDTLIAEKERVILLSEEKLESLMNHVITNGLDLNVPFKPSGVEWLGDVPKQWKVLKIKHLTKILRGKFSHRPRNDPKLYDGKHPFIQTGDVANANKFIFEYTQTLNEDGYAVSKEFPAGTLVMTIAANIGDMAILDFNACFPDSIVGFIPFDKTEIFFLYYLFVAMRKLFLSTAVLNTQLNLNVERIGELYTVVPPLKEQIEIINFLDKEIQRIDALNTNIQESIALLKERRSALITAAVTGQIKPEEMMKS
jgi:type I restriction enzyme, S subunit